MVALRKTGGVTHLAAIITGGCAPQPPYDGINRIRFEGYVSLPPENIRLETPGERPR
jgi:hypothetical protein